MVDEIPEAEVVTETPVETEPADEGRQSEVPSEEPKAE